MVKAIRWNEAQLAEYENRGRRELITPANPRPTNPAKPPKFNNKKCEWQGIKFDSQAERDRYLQLRALERAGQIQDLKHQVKFELVRSVKFPGESRATPAIRYFADFTYQKDGQLVVEDVKSDITRKHPRYRLKRHMMLALLGITITEV